MATETKLTLKPALPPVTLALEIPGDSLSHLPVGAEYSVRSDRVRGAIRKTGDGFALEITADSVSPELTFEQKSVATSNSESNTSQETEKETDNRQEALKTNGSTVVTIALILGILLLISNYKHNKKQ